MRAVRGDLGGQLVCLGGPSHLISSGLELLRLTDLGCDRLARGGPKVEVCVVGTGVIGPSYGLGAARGWAPGDASGPPPAVGRGWRTVCTSICSTRAAQRPRSGPWCTDRRSSNGSTRRTRST